MPGQERLIREAMDAAQAFGCAMCGGDVTRKMMSFGAPKIGESELMADAKLVTLTATLATPYVGLHDKMVAVCGQCYPRLATAEGINELTQRVNG